MRLLWGLLFLLALAASRLFQLTLAVIAAVLLFPRPRREYGRTSVTLKGEVVRSYSEKVIADWFYRNGVRYAYEYPAFDRRGSVISRPDFYLPDYGVYVEYWGLAGVSLRYDTMTTWKSERYRRNGIRVVPVYPGEVGILDAVLKLKLNELSYC